VSSISDKTIERLSLYRRLLLDEFAKNRDNIYSHEIADLADITPAQVRRDLMSLEHSGNPRKGYKIIDIINEIGQILGSAVIKNVAVVGVGNLGRAIICYFTGKRADLPMVAAFDVDQNIVGKTMNGCPCFHLSDAGRIIQEKNIEIMVLAVPINVTQDIVETMVKLGIKSFVNFAHVPLKVPSDVFVENIDITLSIEKAAYFANRGQEK